MTGPVSSTSSMWQNYRPSNHSWSLAHWVKEGSDRTFCRVWVDTQTGREAEPGTKICKVCMQLAEKLGQPARSHVPFYIGFADDSIDRFRKGARTDHYVSSDVSIVVGWAKTKLLNGSGWAHVAQLVDGQLKVVWE